MLESAFIFEPQMPSELEFGRDPTSSFHAPGFGELVNRPVEAIDRIIYGHIYICAHTYRQIDLYLCIIYVSLYMYLYIHVHIWMLC